MSEQLKFTPGPWETDDEAIFTSWKTGHQKMIGRIFEEGNQNLVAAAPDLYEALNRMVGHFSMLPPDMDQPGSIIANARAALAKAEGASDEAV